ncbi:MAG TPA: hypothetical protein VJ843_03430 [Candidatus Saccharimonadales bacterium]|nr:hypothetical protein [Candidatus Saccharimonadales bacterium]
MRLTTHIIGTHKAPIAVLCDQLLAQDIKATHPGNDEFFNTSEWSEYEVDLCNYEAIAARTILIVCNVGPITTTVAQQICYAMAKNKPIILTNELVFAPDVNHRLADIIVRHAQQLHSSESVDHLGNFLHTLPRKQLYNLTTPEQLRIAMTCREHFRELLQKPAKHLSALPQNAHAL